MTVVLLIASLPFFIISLWAILFNWYVISLHLRRSRERIPSIGPLIGGVFGAVAVWLCPLISDKTLVLIPLIADPGIWYLVLVVILITGGYIRGETVSVNDDDSGDDVDDGNDD